MNKKLLAAAVGVALAAPAFAQSSNVTLYGRINTVMEQAKTGGFGSETAMRNYSSRLGVRGVEDLGGGLKAIFGIEAGLASDTGNANGSSTAGITATSVTTPSAGTATTTTTNATATSFGEANSGYSSGFSQLRNVYVGIDAGKAGKFVVGRLDGAVLAPLYNQVYGVIDSIGYDAGNAQLSNVSAASRAGTMLVTQRVSNAFGYGVNVAGVQVDARYAMIGRNDIVGASGTAVNGENDIRDIEVAGTYKLGAATVGLGLEKLSATTPLSIASPVSNGRLQLVGGYDFGVVKLGAELSRNSLDKATLAAGAKDKSNEFALSAKAPFGAAGLIATYARRDVLATTTSAKATQAQIGGYYDFSKRTQAYAMFNRTDTDTKTIAATETKMFGLGLRHNF